MSDRSDDLPDRQRVLLREFEVTLIVPRNAHHCPGAILHQDIVCHPHRNYLAAERIDREHTGVESFLFLLTYFAARGFFAFYSLREGFDVALQCGTFEQLREQWMFC